MDKSITTQSALEELKNTAPALLLYFYNDSCAPCVALRPKVEEMIAGNFPKMEHTYINAALFPELSASNGVFASPTIIVLFEGKETFRVSKYVSVDDLETRIRRYYGLLFS